MPRRVTSRIHDYFIYDVNRSICQLANKEGFVCNAAIKGRHAGNLEKHVKTWHEEEWTNYWNDKTQQLNPPNDAETSLVNTTPHFVNVDLSLVHSQVIEYESEEVQSQPEIKKRKIFPSSTEREIESYVEKDREMENISPKTNRSSDIEDALIEMVTVNGYPFKVVEESGCKKLAALAYKTSDQSISAKPISRNKIQKLVKTKAEYIKTNIIELLNNKLICLRIDCAVVDKRHVFGIGVHLRKSNNYLIFNLRVISLPSDHTQDILKEEILNVLFEFRVGMPQIYHVVVTNCFQSLKATYKSEDTQDSKVQSSSALISAPAGTSSTLDEFLEYNNYDSDFDIFEVEETEYDPDEDHGEIECDEVTNDEATDRLVEEVITCWSHEKHIITARNLTHVFQLSVLDTFDEEPETNVLLKKLRNIVKKLRTPSYLRQLKSFRCKKKPLLDSKYRLLSSYDMLQRFVELKPYLDQLSASIPDIVIPLHEWNRLMDMADSLKPLKMAIIRLTSKDVPVSEFYKIWITSFLKTKKIGTEFSLRLCKNIDKRKSWLFSNVTFKACLFLDPRFKNTLGLNDHKDVTSHLVQIYERIIALKPDSLDEEAEESTVQCNIKLEHPADDEDDDLFQYVKSMVKTPVKQLQKPTDIHAALKTFKDSEPLLEIEDVPAFWQEKKYLYKEVYKLSQIIFAIPPNNAFLDLFSSQLKYISSLNKNSVEYRMLNEIVLLRSNFSLWNREY